MAESTQSIQIADMERYPALAHAGQTTAESRQSLALEGTDGVTEPSSDNATGYPPDGTGWRGFLNTATRARSTSSVSSLRSSTTSIKPAHWTNSFVDYAPVPPPRQKQRVDPGPPSLPPLTLGSSILNDFLHEESPVLRSLPDIPESHDLEFPRVTDGQEGTNRQRRPPESVYSSPSNMSDSTDDVRSSRSTASDSDGPRTDDSSPQSIMDLPAIWRHSFACSFGMGDPSMPDNEQFPDNPHATLAGLAVGDPPRKHRKVVAAIRNGFRNRIQRKPVEVACAEFQQPVVLGPPRVSRTGIQYDVVSYPSDDRSFLTTSEYIGCFCWCQMGSAS